MQIGFDAKRVFENKSGLGNYGRDLLDSICKYEPGNHFHLYAPKLTGLFDVDAYPDITTHTPRNYFHKTIRSLWRSKVIVQDLQRDNLDLFHGLSSELPFGIQKLPLAKIVSVHDLNFERFPQQYKRPDVWIYRIKTRYACKVADAVVAMSEQTKADLIHYYKISPDKIKVSYQCCNESFLVQHTAEELKSIKARYGLPDQYFLFVGDIIERKNLLTICKALLQMQQPCVLVVIGRGHNEYFSGVKNFIAKNKLQSRIIFLNEHPEATHTDYRGSKDLPAIYQLATALIYPSLWEGFGLPVLEGISSGIPVITSNRGSMPEVGGPGALYIDPLNESELAEAMQKVMTDRQMVSALTTQGKIHAQGFSKKNISAEMMALYKSFIK